MAHGKPTGRTIHFEPIQSLHFRSKVFREHSCSRFRNLAGQRDNCACFLQIGAALSMSGCFPGVCFCPNKSNNSQRVPVADLPLATPTFPHGNCTGNPRSSWPTREPPPPPGANEAPGVTRLSAVTTRYAPGTWHIENLRQTHRLGLVAIKPTGNPSFPTGAGCCPSTAYCKIEATCAICCNGVGQMMCAFGQAKETSCFIGSPCWCGVRQKQSYLPETFQNTSPATDHDQHVPWTGLLQRPRRPKGRSSFGGKDN